MFSLTSAILILAVCLFLLWRGKQFSEYKQLGIPGPEPNILFGNLLELIWKGPIHCHKEWIRKYGRIVGYYVFGLPIILVADLDILRKIQISDFQNFVNRPFSIQPPKNQKGGEFLLQLVNLRDKRWKDIRTILTPSFTTSKMRGMSPVINSSVDTLIEILDQKCKEGKSFDIYKIYQALTMDVIGKTAFGIQTNCQKDPNDPFLRTARIMISGGVSSYITSLALSCPQFKGILATLAKIPMLFKNEGKDPMKELTEAVRQVIKTRKEQPNKARQDLLQLMIDAKMSESEINKVTGSGLTATSEDPSEESEAKTATDSASSGAKTGKIDRHMDSEEIVDNAVLFFLAGYETTSTALAFTTHFLIHYPEIQQKLRDEVNELVKREGKLDYASVNQLQYMEQVLSEGLRMYPPIYLFVNREAAKDTDFGSFRIKKGMTVMVPVYTLQHDPEFWEDPEEFRPERFAPENKSKINMMAYQVFGAGPRNCVGMRFAQMEAKMALARILQKYKLITSEESDPLQPRLGTGPVTLTPKRGVFLKVIPV